MCQLEFRFQNLPFSKSVPAKMCRFRVNGRHICYIFHRFQNVLASCECCLIFIHLTREARSSGIRAFINIVHNRKFSKTYQNILRFRFFFRIVNGSFALLQLSAGSPKKLSKLFTQNLKVDRRHINCIPQAKKHPTRFGNDPSSVQKIQFERSTSNLQFLVLT